MTTPTFTDTPHTCQVPTSDAPNQPNWVGYWMCPDCRKEYRLERGPWELWVNGKFEGWPVSYRVVTA